ncbi:hypothetical protein MAR_026539 [Mya arenaria]|uniref:Uncharacterized protein n=1 Tax=Mya arenaria TaxID=6604 RepID=A0ABY7ETC4_MYAAR|nr:hypothetical protein MAR_026539 [Mya arenaria]
MGRYSWRLESRGIFSPQINLHIECVRFCFTQILQHELDTVRQEWNDHPIRRQNGDEINGRPEILYQHPDLYGMLIIIIRSDRCELFVFTAIHVQLYECVRFCFTQILQHELDTVRQEWNDHPIRRQNGDEINGRPEILYQHPDLYGTRDYEFPVEMADVVTFRSFCKTLAVKSPCKLP